jgi:hypothetical protein
MEQSHTQLGKTKEEYHTQAGMLKQSKGLLGTLNWQQTAVRGEWRGGGRGGWVSGMRNEMGLESALPFPTEC